MTRWPLFRRFLVAMMASLDRFQDISEVRRILALGVRLRARLRESASRFPAFAQRPFVWASDKSRGSAFTESFRFESILRSILAVLLFSISSSAVFSLARAEFNSYFISRIFLLWRCDILRSKKKNRKSIKK